MSEADMLKGRNPFLWKGDSREAVLCIHGFVGAPGVFRKLGRKLQSDALTVYAPMLPGHGTVPEDLADVTGEQLLGAVEQAYTKLARSYERVHLAGLSLGGTLATLLAANHAGESSLGCISLISPCYEFNKVLAKRGLLLCNGESNQAMVIDRQKIHLELSARNGNYLRLSMNNHCNISHKYALITRRS